MAERKGSFKSKGILGSFWPTHHWAGASLESLVPAVGLSWACLPITALSCHSVARAAAHSVHRLWGPGCRPGSPIRLHPQPWLCAPPVPWCPASESEARLLLQNYSPTLAVPRELAHAPHQFKLPHLDGFLLSITKVGCLQLKAQKEAHGAWHLISFLLVPLL